MKLLGKLLDDQTRCEHYHSPLDVIAIRFACCETYYSCYECHRELAGHEPQRWPRARFDEPAVLCGVCRTELTATVYFGCGYRCPSCAAAFNPGCGMHEHLYFETD
jgi:uncharacterized CHY-type Zn-finger protein